MHCYNVYADAEATACAAAAWLTQRIHETLQKQRSCRIALPGGGTPARCLELLAGSRLPWQRIHCFIGDERCLAVGDAERNDTMIAARLWSRIDIPAANIHVIEAERGADAAAAAYSRVLDAEGPRDIALLGMGEDGHTASLFPGNPALEATTPAVAVFDAPKPPPQRVTMSTASLRAAGARAVLVTGAGKAAIMQRIRNGEKFPVTSIGQCHWFLDQAASGTAGN
jgi:6-phosphogluconolactonase